MASMDYRPHRLRVLRALSAVSATIASLSLVACLDIVHHVTRDDAEQTVVFVRFAFSRMLLEFAQENTEDDQCASIASDADSLIDQDTQGISIEVSEIDTELECGTRIRLSGNLAAIGRLNDEINDDRIPLIPLVESDQIVVLFPDQDFDLDDEYSGVALAVMSSAKYRLRVSKSHFPTVKRALFQTNIDSLPLAIEDYGDVFEIELPLIYWMAAEGDSFLIVDRRVPIVEQ